MNRERGGGLLCLLSAAAFSSSTIFGRLALDDDAGVLSILPLPCGGAVPLFWALVRLTRQPLPSRSVAVQAVILGAVVVAPQALLIYSALTLLDAGLVTVL